MTTRSQIPFSNDLDSFQLDQAQPSRTGNGKAFYACYLINSKTNVVKSFGFDIPPQSINLSEQAAAEAVPLQGGNFYTDERGQYFKDLEVSGIFGFRPTKAVNQGVFRNLQRSANQLSDAVGNLTNAQPSIPQQEVTGFQRYARLHNIVREYWDLKLRKETATYCAFVWADWKKGEVYVAQPLAFRRNRSAPTNRFTVGYQLTMRLLVPLDVKVSRRDFLIQLNTADGFTQFLKKASQARDVANRAVRVANASITSLVDVGEDLVSTTLSYVDTAIQSMDLLLSGVQNAVTFPANVAKQTLERIYEVANLFQATGRFFGDDLARLYRRIGREYSTMVLALQQGENKSTLNEDVGEYGRQYAKRSGDDLFLASPSRGGAAIPPLPSTSGARRFVTGDRGSGTLLGARVPEGEQAIPLIGHTSIKQLADRYLGSASRWKEIAILNRLQPPYISPQGDGKRVLRPNVDMIRIPASPSAGGNPNQVYASLDQKKFEDLRKYGRDLKINLTTFDFEVSASGDIETVEGRENVVQALNIKIKTKPGDLKLHPWFGFGADAGQVVQSDTAALVRFQALVTLLSDTRVDEVPSMAVNVDGDRMGIKAIVRLKEQDNSLALNFKM